MASTTREILFERFQAIVPESDTTSPSILESGYGNVSALSQTVNQASELAKTGNTGSSIVSPGDVLTGVEPSQSTASAGSSSTSSSGIGGTILSVASTVFESGLGLVPLVSGLLGLFGGGGAASPAPLEKYAMPDRLYFTGSDAGRGFTEADYDQFGMARGYGSLSGDNDNSRTGQLSTPDIASGLNPGNDPRSANMPSNNGTSGASPQINVTVQAMDAQSFLDRSNDIAQAVRQAMLSLNSINDVMSDL